MLKTTNKAEAPIPQYNINVSITTGRYPQRTNQKAGFKPAPTNNKQETQQKKQATEQVVEQKTRTSNFKG